MSITILIASVFLSIAFYTDIRWMRIPNSLTLSTLIIGILVHLWTDQWNGLLFSLMGMGVGFLFTLIFHFLGALGAGDVKGFAALGAITGMEFSLYVLIYALIYASVIGIVFLVIRGRLKSIIYSLWISFVCLFTTRDKIHLIHIKRSAIHTFPFMIAVIPAYLTYMYSSHGGL